MINRQNYLDVNAYLRYLIDVRQVSESSYNKLFSRFKHLLVWADTKPLTDYKTIKPTFPKYLENLKTNEGALLAPAYITSIFKNTRAFLFWAKREWPTRYKALDNSTIDSIRPSRERSETAVLVKRELYTLDDMLKIVSIRPETLSERRLIAGMAFLFLSGMRITAFLSMPIRSVDLEQWRVLQLPEYGVKTKNSKAAITFLLNIPDLREIVSEWDKEIRKALPITANWYPVIDPFGEFSTVKRASENSRNEFYKAMKNLFNKHGIKYLSPHKFRHGHAVYALKNSKSVIQAKAISQNLMHSNMGITDGIYGRLVSDDQKNLIHNL